MGEMIFGLTGFTSFAAIFLNQIVIRGKTIMVQVSKNGFAFANVSSAVLANSSGLLSSFLFLPSMKSKN